MDKSAKLDLKSTKVFVHLFLFELQVKIASFERYAALRRISHSTQLCRHKSRFEGMLIFRNFSLDWEEAGIGQRKNDKKR